MAERSHRESGRRGRRRNGAVLGSPIAHSLSPVLHRAAYDELGLTEWTYAAVECGESELRDVLHELDAAGMAGVSLTMPLKRAVLPMLAGCDPLVADVAAANTVIFGDAVDDWQGFNTDVAGVVASLPAIAGEFGAAGGPLILGAGATAGSAIAALAQLGVRAVWVAARRPAAVDTLAAVAARFGVTVAPLPLDWTRLGEAAAAAPLVVSTLPAGVAAPLAGVLPRAVAGTLFDVVYAGWPTAVARGWQARGGRVVSGLELLVHQAALQVRLMTGRDPSIAVMRTAGAAALAH